MKNKIPLLLFAFSLMFFSFCYGFVAAVMEWPPYPQIAEGVTALDEYFNPWFYVEGKPPKAGTTHDRQRIQPGLNLVTCIGPERTLVAKVMDMEGNELHRWDIDWFEIWPDAEHIPWQKPTMRPGTSIHGAVLTREGDLIFNFESLGLVRLAKNGEVMWKLPYQTHHSIYMDETGALWISGEIDHETSLAEYPNYEPQFVEFTLLKVSVDGKILKEMSLFDVLRDNGLYGLLTMQATDNFTTTITGDTLHLNDVETFPAHMEEGFFRHGDIMVSLRNINAVLVLTPGGDIKYSSIGKYVRQHDPDFIDGNTITVFDNNNVTGASLPSSRIMMEHVPSGTTEVYFEGTREQPFFSDIMGKHQWLPGGNLLVTESHAGRAFELAPDGTIVWEYHNVIDSDTLGVVTEVQRLPDRFATVFPPAGK